jgi:DNA processing protein
VAIFYPMSEISYFNEKDWPIGLKHIPDKPQKLRIRGTPPKSNNKYVCVVGTRKPTSYAEDVCKYLIEGLRNYPISIVSGLAYGIDVLAHKTAIENNLQTISFPGSGLGDDVIYPRAHINVSKEILRNEGCLISEFKDSFKATKWSFPKRNRLMVGISNLVLIIEATMVSGTMITARLSSDYNTDVATIPGSIFSKNNEGNNFLLKNGAYPITSPGDILDLLGIDKNIKEENIVINSEEREIFKLLDNPLTKEEIIKISNVGIVKLNFLLTSLELKNLVKESDGKFFKSTQGFAKIKNL